MATVGAIGQYDPKSKNLLVKPLFKDIDLQSNGGTDSTSFLWTGDILMDLDRTQARKMELNTLDGGDNLFSEAGGFGSANPAGWKPPADDSQAPLTLSE